MPDLRFGLWRLWNGTILVEPGSEKRSQAASIVVCYIAAENRPNPFLLKRKVNQQLDHRGPYPLAPVLLLPDHQVDSA